MKKLLTLSFVMLGLVLTVPLAQAAENPVAAVTTETLQQRRGNQYRRDNRRRNRVIRTFYRTRTVRYGRRQYRETYRIRVFRNGRRQVTLVKRVPVNRRYRNRRNY